VIRLPYNHVDDADRQRPLPIRIHKLPAFESEASSRMETAFTALPTAGGRLIRLRLDTDSPHLAHFFALNWPEPEPGNAAFDARIVARRRAAASYGLPRELDDARWYCHETRQVWITGSEYYGNLKITVRGLCSELAPPDEMFVHGCAMLVGGRGLVLSGTSGVGKTTLTAAIRSLQSGAVRIVNDDWGPLSLATLDVRYTGEPRLHMKYPSVRALTPSLWPTPNSHPSENFHGDPGDPRARLMIAREEVFGPDGIADRGQLALFVVVARDEDEPASLYELNPDDVDLVEHGRYSSFYARTECFLNGSLFLTLPEQRLAQRTLHRRLLGTVRCVRVNNGGPPAHTVALILGALRGVPARRTLRCGPR